MQQVEIRVKGVIDEHWSEWFNGLALHYDQAGETLLSGQVPDSAALYGIISRLRDLGLPLCSLNCIDIVDPKNAAPP
ncbi:hypothetical protein ACFLZW_06055 [Chloroflexota bacterium]